MFFTASKILSFFIWPTNIILLLVLAGTALVVTGRRAVLGKRLLLAGVALLLACGFGPIGHWLVLPLEQRFARGPLPADVAGVIMLGGFESGQIGKARGHLTINEAGDRLTEGVLVALVRPQALVVFTGGDASLINPTSGAAAATVGQFLEAIGIARQRIVLEGRSRTTYENAFYLRDMLKPQPGRRWVLVTSAFHMPRSVGTFRQLGFDVLPWPADYRTRGTSDALTGFGSLTDGLERTDMAFKEWIGLIAYRLTGRSMSLWPGPEAAPLGAAPAPAGTPAAPLPER